jgi:hypothetical protein
MKLANCTVSYDGYNEIGGTEERLNLLEYSVKKAREMNVDIICFPGGYLFGSSEKHLKELAKKISRLADENKIAIVTGVNLKEKDEIKDDIEKTQSSSFAVCKVPNSEKYNIWYQRSVTSTDRIPALVCHENRNIKVSGKSVEVLICGEIFNSHIRDSFIKRKLNVVVDIAHEADGFRVERTMGNISKNDIACFCSIHADMRGAMKRACYPKEIKKSTRNIDILVEKSFGPRIEITLWDI